MKIQLETREGDKTVIDLNQDQLANLCVEACGGGHTEQQTANAHGDGAEEYIGSPTSPPRSRVVRNVTHQRVGNRIGQPWKCAEQAHQGRVHPEPEIENDDHAADGSSE